MGVIQDVSLVSVLVLFSLYRFGRGEGWLLRDVVKRLRRRMGDDAADPRYIITEPRVGYRMAAAGTGQRANDGAEYQSRSLRSSLSDPWVVLPQPV